MENKVVLEVRHLSKFFDGVKAVNDVSLKLYQSEIIAIVGDNGAGKSTFIKTLSGVHEKDRGDCFIDGKRAIINTPFAAKKYGIETVYQDQGLIHQFDAAQNLFLGRMKRRDGFAGRWFGFMDRGYMRKEAKALLSKMGINLEDLKTPLGHLSGGQRQAVKVGKAVYWGGRILIFDEPTNNMGVKQERNIIDLIRRIRDEDQVSIIIISHNIAHVFELVDRIIVLRNGRLVGERPKSETTPHEIVSMITGVSP